MVVSILALLFVVVTGFLSVSRFQRLATQEAKRGDVMTRIVDSVNDLVRAKIAEQLRDPAGRVAAFEGGATPPQITWEDTAGVRGASYIGAIDPVREPTGGASNDPNVLARQTIYPAVTSLDRLTRPLQPRLADLLLDYNTSNPVLDANDLRQNARVAWMDADGEGVADSSFVGVAAATELANAIAGVPVRAPRWSYDPNAATDPNKLLFKPSQLADPNTLGTASLQWQRFAELSRYTAAVRVVPHGGMVALDSPGQLSATNPVWNRQFAVGMFNLVKSANDPAMPSNLQTQNLIFNGLDAQQAAVENALRQRGGFLPTYAPGSTTTPADRSLAATPPILRMMEADGINPRLFAPFRNTFDPARDPVNQGSVLRPYSWQRINLVDAGRGPDRNDGTRWYSAARVNAFAYNGGTGGPGGWDTAAYYSPRHLLTSASTSDELTRRLRPDHELNAGAARAIGLRQGQQKFYLGWLQDAFDNTTNEFLGYPLDPNVGAAGNRIARELINYYADMLSGHEFSAASGGYYLPPDADTLREQATMLAANTLAYAAPRRNNGFVAVVGVPEPNAPTPKLYYGFAPQPFISQVAVHSNGASTPSASDVTVVVELFNPSDPGDQSGVDPHALKLEQFALTFNDSDPSNPATRVQLGLIETTTREIAGPVPSQADRFPGRRFMTLVIRGGLAGGNTVFDNLNLNGKVSDLLWTVGSATGVSTVDITVNLWRGRGTGSGPDGWHKVDEFPIQVDIDPNNNPSWSAAWRDCSTETYNQDVTVATVPPATLAPRWRVVLAPSLDEPNEPNSIYHESKGLGSPIGITIGQTGPVEFTQTLGNEAPDADTTGSPASRFGPTTPMYTMNAGMGDPSKAVSDPNRYGDLAIHGARRPRSFPTPGFAMLIPRFSHVRDPNSFIVSKAMGRVMYDQWRADPNKPDLVSLPADFGHMPVFDNHQPAYNPNPIPNPSIQSRYFTNAASGKVPWGQLVFDYFTTLDPNTPNLDPARVPGRINVNAAPWFVLSRLPVLGPLKTYDAAKTAALPLAVRDVAGGGFFGQDRSSNWRFLGDVVAVDPNYGSSTLPESNNAFGSGYSYILGPWLAQAAAAYRDGLAYLPTGNAAAKWQGYARAPQRNVNGTGRYRDVKYDKLRGEPTAPGAPTQYGFLTIGELANVVGFDSTAPSALKSSTPLIEAGNPLGTGGDPRHGDYLKAISLVTLLDSHFLTTRSNTFTVYVTISDRENPQASVRSQMTVDRSNVLPKLVTRTSAGQFLTTPVTLEGDELPAIIAQRRAGYYNARFDN